MKFRTVLICLFALLILPLNVQAKTYSVTWDPRGIEQTLGLGGGVDLTATFVSKVTLNNVDLFVVPELQPFVSLNQTHFETVQANTPYQVTLQFSIPFGSQTGLYDGTIHVRVGSQTYPQTLKVELSVVDAAATIGPEGGVVEVTDPDSPIYGAHLIFPVESLDQNTMFLVRYDALHDSDDLMARPIIVDHHDIQLHEDVILTLPLREVLTEDTTLMIMMFDDELNTYFPTGLLVDVSAGDTLAHCPLAHLSGFSLDEAKDALKEMSNATLVFLITKLGELSNAIDKSIEANNTEVLLTFLESWDGLSEACEDEDACIMINEIVWSGIIDILGCGTGESVTDCVHTLRSNKDDLLRALSKETISICDKINGSHWAYYPETMSSIYLKVRQVDVTDRGDCMGRCGDGCPGDDSIWTEWFPCEDYFRYTQACLNHDACGEDLGLGSEPCVRILLITTHCVDDCRSAPICENAREVRIDFTAFPNGSPIPLNINGQYGVPGTTIFNHVTDEFESWGVVFVSAPCLPTILGGPPACPFCGPPPIGGILIEGAGFCGEIHMSFLDIGFGLPSSLTLEVIGSGLNISASLEAFDANGNSLGTVAHTYTGPTGQLSPFSFSAPAGQRIATAIYNSSLNPSAIASIGTLIIRTAGP